MPLCLGLRASDPCRACNQCAGPFGIEGAVQAAGPGPTLLGILLLPLVWGLPQALITAELASLVDENGGSVLWVVRGLGPYWGFMCSWNSFLSGLVDLPLYAMMLGAC